MRSHLTNKVRKSGKKYSLIKIICACNRGVSAGRPFLLSAVY